MLGANPSLHIKNKINMIKNLNIKIDDSLLEKFDKKIEESNESLMANKLNRSTVLRNMIINYIQKKLK